VHQVGFTMLTIWKICVSLYHTIPGIPYILAFCYCLTSLVGLGPRSDIPRSHTHTHTHTHTHSLGPFWTSDRSDAESCAWQHTTLTRDRHLCPLLDSDPQSRLASGRQPTPWPRGHWDRLMHYYYRQIRQKEAVGAVASERKVIKVTQTFSGWKWKFYINMLHITMIFKLILKN
jgi:hypothetical protein